MRSVLLTFLLLLPGIAEAQIPVLNVSTSRLSFITSGTSQFPPSQQVRIKNTGSGSLRWRATTATPWLHLSPGEGTAPATLTVTIETAQIANGDYAGRITVTADDADDSPATIEVSLKLVAASKAPPEPAAQPVQPPAPSQPQATSQGTEDNRLTQVRLSAPIGSRTPVTSTVEIGAPPGSRAVAWTARSDQRWLTVEPAQGTTPGAATIKASPGGLPAGENRATVQFVDGSGMPLLVVPVVLAVGLDAAAGPATAGLSLSTTAMPAATRNLPYSQAIPIRGGTPPYLVQLLQGRLPPGLLLANGAISGVSRIAGAYVFALGVMDSSKPPQRIAQQMSLRVVTIFQDTALVVVPPAVGITITGNQPQQPVRLAVSSGAQSLEWHASSDAPWLRVIPADGLSPGIVQLDVIAQGLAAGSYTATVTVMMEGVPNSPARISVQLLVRK